MSRVVLLCLVVLLGCAAAIAVTTMLHGSQTAQPVSRLEGTDIWPSGTRPAPNFALRDQTGQLVTRKSLRGQVWAITFLDSNCTKACPVEARDLATVQRQLGSSTPFKIIIVSVLPGYDNPARVQAFAHKSGLTTQWHWLLGTKQQLAPVWKRYGIWVVTGIEHTAAVYLVDRHGDVRVADGVPFLPDQLAASIRALTAPAGSHA